MDPNDLCVWPDQSYCEASELDSWLLNHSDDYEVVPYDSFLAAYITGALEAECHGLFGHVCWQMLSDDDLTKLKAHMGIEEK